MRHLLPMLLAPALLWPSVARPASIRILETGGGISSCIPSWVLVQILDLQEPVKAIEFGLELPPEAVFSEWLGLDRLRLEWESCEPLPDGTTGLLIDLDWLWEDGRRPELATICVVPAQPPPIEPPAPAYQRCDESWVALELAPSPMWPEEEPGCALSWSNSVALLDHSWGTVKARFGVRD